MFMFGIVYVFVYFDVVVFVDCFGFRCGGVCGFDDFMFGCYNFFILLYYGDYGFGDDVFY